MIWCLTLMGWRIFDWNHSVLQVDKVVEENQKQMRELEIFQRCLVDGYLYRLFLLINFDEPFWLGRQFSSAFFQSVAFD